MALEVSRRSSWLLALRMFSSVVVLKHRPAECLLERGRAPAPSHCRPIRRSVGVPGMLQVSPPANSASSRVTSY